MLRRLVFALFPVDRLGRTDRWLVALMWLVGLLQGFAASQSSATVPFTRSTLGLSEGEMSLVLAVTRIAGVTALLFSWWGDRRGRRKPFLASYVLLIVAAALTAAAQSPLQYTLLQSIVRATTTAVATLAVVLLAEQVEGPVRPFSISLYGAGGSLGAGIGLAALPLADSSPEAWRLLFALSAVGLLAVPLLARRVGESAVFTMEGLELQSREPAGLTGFLRAGYRRRFWLSSGAGFLAAAFSAVGLAFSTERLVDDLGLPTPQAVTISLIGGTVGGMGFFVGGRLADTWGRRATTMLSFVAILVGGVAVYWVSTPVLLTIAIAVSTFGSFAYVPAAASHRAELFPTAFRTSAGTAGAYLAMMGSASGLFAGRLTIDRIGLPQTMLWLGSVILVAIVLTALLPETKGHSLSATSPDR